MTLCKLCGESIHFDDKRASPRTGKLIPLNEGGNEQHQCEEWKALHRRYYNCKYCNAEIYFDDKHISKNGKYIPLSKVTGEPHQCDEPTSQAQAP